MYIRYYGRALLRTIDESLSSVEGEDHDLEPPSEWLHNDPSLPGSVDAATAATAARHRLLATLYERSYDLKVSLFDAWACVVRHTDTHISTHTHTHTHTHATHTHTHTLTHTHTHTHAYKRTLTLTHYPLFTRR